MMYSRYNNNHDIKWPLMHFLNGEVNVSCKQITHACIKALSSCLIFTSKQSEWLHCGWTSRHKYICLHAFIFSHLEWISGDLTPRPIPYSSLYLSFCMQLRKLQGSGGDVHMWKKCFSGCLHFMGLSLETIF